MMLNVTKMVIVTGAVAAACVAALAAPPKVYPPVATPMMGGHAAILDPNLPSYRFTEHVTRSLGQLIELDKWVVALEGTDYPSVIFAKWEEFESFATCEGDEAVTCRVSYYVYGSGELLQFVLPLEAASSHDYLVQMASPGSDEIRATPPLGPGEIAVLSRHMPSSQFAQRMTLSPSKLREIELGVIAIDLPNQDYPHLLYAFGPGFQASGHCAKLKIVGCFIDFYEHDDGIVRPYLIKLEDALKRDTYVNLRELQEADRLEWEALTSPPQS